MAETPGAALPVDTVSRINVATLIARIDPATAIDLTASAPSKRDLPLKVALPVRLHRVDGNEPGVFWFEMALPPRAAMSPEPALFLPRLTDGGTFFLNGESIFMIPGADALRRVRWRRARTIVLPTHLLRDNDNVLTARITSRDFTVDFPFMLLGPALALQAESEARQWVDQYGSQFTGITAVVVGLFILGIWWFRRSERYYLWFGLTSLLWALRSINYSIEVMPTDSWWWWRAAHFLTVAAATGTLIGFFFSFAGLRWRRMGWVMLGYALIGPILVVASNGRWHEGVYVWWQAPLFLGIGIALVRFARWGYQHRSREVLVITIGVLVAVGLAGNDYATISGLFEHTRVYTLHLALPVLLLTIGILLTMRFVAALRATEDANRVLALRLGERERELAIHYARAGEIERREAKAAERHRIMQDMHDGLGAQLVSSLAVVERGDMPSAEIAHLIRESLDELRIAIDAFSDEDVDLQGALASLRHRMTPRFAAAGMLLEWNIDDDFAKIRLDDHATMQVLHIVHEALANAFRHSRATHVQVDMGADRRTCRLVITDNGGGPGTLSGTQGMTEVPSAAGVTRGRGLNGIRKRAHSLGGDADVAIGPKGTVVNVRWPASQLPEIGQMRNASADSATNT